MVQAPSTPLRNARNISPRTGTPTLRGRRAKTSSSNLVAEDEACVEVTPDFADCLRARRNGPTSSALYCDKWRMPLHFSIVIVMVVALSFAAQLKVSIIAQDHELTKANVQKALACAGHRWKIVDVLVGAPMEFSGAEAPDTPKLRDLISFACSGNADDADHPYCENSMPGQASKAETAIREMLTSLTRSGRARTRELKERLLAILTSTCGEIMPLETVPLEVDETSSSMTVHRRSLYSALLRAGTWLPGHPEVGERISRLESSSAQILVNPSRPRKRQCLVFTGNATISFRVGPLMTGEMVRCVTLEQPPRWAMPEPTSSPRKFSIRGQRAGADGPSNFSLYLGSGEYLLAAPAIQTFKLAKSANLTGLQVTFEEGWGAKHTCVYRFRAHTSCPSSRRGTGVVTLRT